MSSTQKWQILGEESVASSQSSPPAPGGWPLNYVLAFDQERGVLVYVREPDHHRFGETWHLSAKGEWIKDHEAIQASSDQFWTGHYDSKRKGVMCWTIRRQAKEEYRVEGLFIDAQGISKIETEGIIPVDPEALSSDSKMIFAFDPVQERNLAITPYAIWYLDASDTWQKLSDLGPEFTREWHENAAARAVWDHVSNRLVIGVVDSEEYEGRLFVFDEKGVNRIEDGLSDDVELYSDNSTFVLASCKEEGVLLVLGAPLGSYRLKGDTWLPLDAPKSEVRRSNAVRAAFDERDGSLWLGPGPYELTPGAYAKNQEFFCQRSKAGEWRVLGHIVQPSPTEWYGGVALAGKDGRLWIASVRYPLGLRIVDTDGWTEVVGEGQADSDGHLVALARDGEGTIHAFARNGAVFKFDGDWHSLVGPDEAFGVREDFLVHWDPTNHRFVAWGGTVKNRASNHTFYLLDSGWVKEKKTSEKPSDTRHKEMFLRPKMVFDPVQGTLVRFGYDDISVLTDGVWVPHVPEGWEQTRSIDAPLPVVDTATGEILVVDLYAKSIYRFNYDKVEKVGQIEDHEFSLDPMEVGTYAAVPHFVRRRLYAYDPDTRAILGQCDKDEAARFKLPLSAAFEAAAALGARKAFAASHKPEVKKADAELGSSVRLYCADKSAKFWFGDVSGSTVLTRWGSVHDWGLRLSRGTDSSKTEELADSNAAQKKLAKEAASKQKKSYISAAELDDDAIKALFTQDIIVMSLGDEAGKYDYDFLGGTPRGSVGKEWPKRDGQPLGHLLSVSVPDGKKVGGVSVFAPTNDLAMEEEELVAVIRSSSQMGKDQGPRPGDVAVIEPRVLAAEVNGFQVDESRTKPFEEADPAFAQRLETFHESLGSDETPWTRWGGTPQWVQHDEWPVDDDGEPWKFVAQIDFDSIAQDFIKNAWPEASLFGVLYVFINPAETEATAFWQYT